MMLVIYFSLYMILGAYLLTLSFFGYCAAKAHWSQLRIEIKVLLAPLFLLYFVDVAFNLIPASLIFFELPTTFTLTQRCTKHLKDTDFRGVLSRYLCNNLLNIFQKDHCT